MVAGLLSWFVYMFLVQDFIFYIRLVLLGIGISERAMLRFTGALIQPLFFAASATTFAIAYLRAQSPMHESIKVLISLAFSYGVIFLVAASYGLIRVARKSGEEWWSPVATIPLLTLQNILTVHLWAVLLIIEGISLARKAYWSIWKVGRYEEIVNKQAEPILRYLKQMQPDKQMQLTTKGLQGTVMLVVLTVGYWFIGVSQLTWFIRDSTYLFIGYFMFELAFAGMRRPEAAQLRWINPFGLASSFVIIFSFYIGIIQGKLVLPITPYLGGAAAFLALLWYTSFLSRREVTIVEGKQAALSEDQDFQVDTARMTISWFYLLVGRLQPLFLAVNLATVKLGIMPHAADPMTNSWLDALFVTVILLLGAGLAYLIIWTRNIAKPRLSDVVDGLPRQIAGTDGRDDYPLYRDQLAASAVPCCIFMSALLFMILTMLNCPPHKLVGVTGAWFDILFYGLLILILFTLFVEVPYGHGQKAWFEPESERLKQLQHNIANYIVDSYEGKSQVTQNALRVIAGELTLKRLRQADSEQRGRLIYKLNVLGEGISGADALAFLRGLIVTAITAGAGFIINRLFQIPSK